MYEEATDKNIITKQVVINTPTSVRLLSITADEKVIDEIQQALNELERLKKQEELVEELVNRDTPEKPLLVETSADNVHHYECLYCGATINIGGTIDYNKVFNIFCRECGQRLDWNDRRLRS